MFLEVSQHVYVWIWVIWHTLSEKKFAPGPLTAVSVKVAIINLLAEVEIVQSYSNEEYRAIEAIYNFPLTGGMYTLRFILLCCLMYNVLMFSSQPGAGIAAVSQLIDLIQQKIAYR